LFSFNNTYCQLPEELFTAAQPAMPANPQLVLFNTKLAEDLHLKHTNLSATEIAQQLSGTIIPNGAQPIAQAYAGHQFGYFNKLGDGRAILLGEILANNNRFDIQLKGSGITTYSRGGDGKATLKAMLREYLISEAKHALKIPTTRSLTVVATNEQVYRNPIQKGAVLTRIASSHIRVGSFEYVSAFTNPDILKLYTDYTIARHYSHLVSQPDAVLQFFYEVMHAQVDLIVNWMRVGFIHGVMNTDNVSIAGETIDYGPCAFMNAYNPNTVFSSIDTNGRYAFANQPYITQWNMAVFANCLIPLVHTNTEEATALLKTALDSFPARYQAQYFKMMCAKLGIAKLLPNDAALINDLLTWMELHQADYTNTFYYLSGGKLGDVAIYQNEAFMAWQARWQERLHAEPDDYLILMRSTNPAFIPRNYLVEQALEATELSGDMSSFEALLARLQAPYYYNQPDAFYQMPPANADLGYKTFCGT
jgi:serine/tyrosine/threonine adenylyltransferase